MKKIWLFSLIILIPVMLFAGWTAGKFLLEEKNTIAVDMQPQKTPEGLPQNNAPAPAPTPQKINHCSSTITLTSENEFFCLRPPKLKETRGIEIDLTNKKALLFEDTSLVKILPVAYQSPEGRWYQTPTGYFRVGVKKEKHTSSLFPVRMPFAVQFYEDFFMHEIPYYLDGTPVTSQFSGGCLRFENGTAKELFDFAKRSDQVVSYKTFDDIELNSPFQSPVKLSDYWIRQRFNNPFRQSWDTIGGDAQDRRLDYYQHTGIDFSPSDSTSDKNIYAIATGTVILVQKNNGADHGLGNVVILAHEYNNELIYSLYAHLATTGPDTIEGLTVNAGSAIGTVGNSGFGCDTYWKIGEDGCDSKKQYGPNDTHLHFELKKYPVLENPESGEACENKDGSSRFCYGYAPDYPQNYGYLNPMEIVFSFKKELTSTSTPAFQ